MKSILFLLEKMPNEADKNAFFNRLSHAGISVFYCAVNDDIKEYPDQSDDSLYVTDSRKCYDYYKS